MKITKIAFAIILCISIISCSSDDKPENLDGKVGNISLKFDNSVGDQDFIFNTKYDKSNNESYKLETLKYLISNIKLKDADGTIYEYPSKKNIFIVDEAAGNNAGEIFINLENIDAGNYTEVSFGLGIDQQRYALGADGQGDFLNTAQQAGMLWSWATGYRFMRFDGTYTSGTDVDAALNMHMGSVGTAVDNYREITLSFPNQVRVRPDKKAEVHIVANIAKVFDGKTAVKFSEGYNQVHVDATTTKVIADNFMDVFTVHHVHNE